ncbi:MAG: nucleotide sugar dehydrogenase [Vicinamibacterales bacterium]
MNVSVFGLGYVGSVTCGCLAADGMSVVGVDANPQKVAALAAGQSPIVEERIGDMIAAAVAAGRLRATDDVEAAVVGTDVSIVSVGTPSHANGSLDLTAVQRVCEQIGAALRHKADRHLVVIRSTVLPGTVRSLVVPTLERTSGKPHGAGFGVCFNPEFLREGTSVKDYYEPPFTLIGAIDERDGRMAAGLYDKVAADVHHSTLETAEMVKYVCNAFHALKITFANEIGLVSQAVGVDSHQVMALVCKDTKLNISSRYLMPGFAFGGSCLPKDVRALLYKARAHDVETPLLASLLPSNVSQVQRAVQLILGLKQKTVAMLGLAFKAGTDDLRESPLVVLAETLIGKGFDIRIYDKNVSIARLTGANKAYIEKEIPHISSLLVPTMADAVAHGNVLIVGNAAPEFADLPSTMRQGQTIVDLVRIPALAAASGFPYHGIAW